MKQVFTNNSFKWVCLIVAASLVITGLYVNLRLHRFEKTDNFGVIYDKFKKDYYIIDQRRYMYSARTLKVLQSTQEQSQNKNIDTINNALAKPWGLRLKLYQNLVKSGKLNMSQLGSEEEFIQRLSSGEAAEKLYDELSKLFSIDEIGTKGEFLNVIILDKKY